MGSVPVVDVLKSGDVVLVEIGARLHLDEEGWDLAGIGEAVLLADGDVGRLVLGEEARFLTLGDLKGSLVRPPNAPSGGGGFVATGSHQASP